MTRARDDARRNARRDFALYHEDLDDGEGKCLVGSFSLGYADGCAEGFTEAGDWTWCDFGDSHVPGSHAEMHALLVEPRRRNAALAGAR